RSRRQAARQHSAEGNRLRIRQPRRSHVRRVRAALRAGSRQVVRDRVRSQKQSADDGRDSREITRRVHEGRSVRARQGGPALHLRRQSADHPGVSVSRQSQVASPQSRVASRQAPVASRLSGQASVVLFLVACVCRATLSGTPLAEQVQTPDPVVLLTQAKQFFDALDYEHAVTALDQAIVVLEGKPAQDPARRSLPGAYEMRARSQFGRGKEPETRADFVALLKADPVFTLTGNVSPRVVAIFDEVLKATVTQMRLVVTPPTAEVRVDGVIVAANTTMPIAVG